MREVKLLDGNGLITEKRFQEVQNIIGKKLPYSYYSLVTNDDGSTPFPNIFKLVKKNGQYVVSCVGAFLAFNPSEYGDIVNEVKHPPEFFPQNLVPFAEVGNGDYICFDYRQDPQTDNPSVVYWSHEDAPEESVSFLAKDFESFLDMLFDDEEEGSND